MNIREKLKAIPGSYEDFVNSTARWMEQDNEIRTAIMNQFEVKPDSTYSDIMSILCEHLGIGEPIELVDEDEYESGYGDAFVPGTVGMRVAY